MKKNRIQKLTLLVFLIFASVFPILVLAVQNEAWSERNMSPLPIRTIFNMSAEEGMKPVEPRIVSLLVLITDWDIIVIPARTELIFVVSNDAPDEEMENAFMRLDDFRQSYPWIEEGVMSISVINEISSNDIIGEIDETFGEFYPREKYFKSLMAPGTAITKQRSRTIINGVEEPSYNRIVIGEGLEDLRIVKVGWYSSIIGYVEATSGRPFDENQSGITEENLKKVVSMQEYRDKIFMKLISPYDWPVSIKPAKTTNSSMPVFNKAASEEKIDESRVGLFRLSDRDDRMKFVLASSDATEAHRSIRDLVTNEVIKDEGIDGVNVEYIKNLGMHEDTSGWMISLHIDGSSSNLARIKTHDLEKAVYENWQHFMDASTYSELIDTYQQFVPLSAQVDYSYFDFSSDPRFIHD